MAEAALPWPEGLAEAYPALAGLPAALRSVAGVADAQIVQVPAGTVRCEGGAPCGGCRLVL